ncbi:hypothetical protein FOA52_009315 [Chlamydomonas sp. UWO 241]|nr:hypothetical protein FOA52_009315 [Chlamydomonas sp. UWO 241]
MYSLLHRANAVLTYFGTVCVVLALLTTSTDFLHKAEPKISLSLADVKRLYSYQGNRDQAVITFNLEADMRSCFSWNTKQLFVFVRAEYFADDGKVHQVSLWDTIIQTKSKAKITLRKHKTKYAFIDHLNDLRNREFNLTLVWDVMPRVGRNVIHSHAVPVGRLPAAYI